MLLRMVYDEVLAQAAYLIGCQETGEAIVIDPERDVDRYLELAAANELRIVAAAETHIHADFLSGARELAEKTGCRLYLSDEGGPDWLYGWLDQKAGGGRYDAVLLKDGDAFTIGNIRFRALHTPGHTPEHIAFEVTDLGGGADEPIGIATGDFVFVGDLGRPDLLESAAGMAGVKEGFARTLNASAERFLDLPDYLQVWPAHGAGSACGKALGAVPTSTVGYEKRFNASLGFAGREREFVEYILHGQPAPPLYFARMKYQNRDGVPLLGELPAPRRLTAAELGAIDTARVVVVDSREWETFRDGHLPGSLWGPRTTQYPMVTGSYIDPEDGIVLVCDESEIDALVRNLVRIGLDRVTGWAAPEDLATLHGLAQMPELTAEAFQQQRETGTDAEALLLDTRNDLEREEASIPGSEHIPHTQLPKRLTELPETTPIVCQCRSGIRSAAAASYLRRRGLNAVNLAGGIDAWLCAGQDVVHSVTIDPAMLRTTPTGAGA